MLTTTKNKLKSGRVAHLCVSKTNLLPSLSGFFTLNNKIMKYSLCHDPSKKFSKTTKLHIFPDGNIDKVLCGSNLSIAYISKPDFNGIDEFSIVDAIERADCIRCLEKAKLINQ